MMVQFSLLLIYLISLTFVNGAEITPEMFDVLSDPEYDPTRSPKARNGLSFRRGQLFNQPTRQSEPPPRKRLEAPRRPQGRNSFANHARHYSFAASSTGSSSHRDESDRFQMSDRPLTVEEFASIIKRERGMSSSTIARQSAP